MFSTEEPIQNEQAIEGSYGEKKGEENIDILQVIKHICCKVHDFMLCNA